ncbi:hypothetical protein GCM10009670_14170 [Citricoccus alkalitolerans]
MITAGLTHGRSGFGGVAAPAGPGVPAAPVEPILPAGRLAEAVRVAVPDVGAVLVAAGFAVVAEGTVAGGVEPVEAVAAGVEAAAGPAAGAPPIRVLAGAGVPPIRFFGTAAASPAPGTGASDACTAWSAAGVAARAAGAPPMRRFDAPPAGTSGTFAAVVAAVGPPAAG